MRKGALAEAVACAKGHAKDSASLVLPEINGRAQSRKMEDQAADAAQVT